jgi:hypothetical protein
VNLKHADLITQVQETQSDEDGNPISVQAKLVKTLWDLYNEAVEYANVNSDAALIKTVDFIEDTLMDTDLYPFELRLELRDRLEAIRLTLGMAMQAEDWGRESYDSKDEDAVIEIALPVLTADEFYEPLFDAIGDFLKEFPEPLPLTA